MQKKNIAAAVAKGRITYMLELARAGSNWNGPQYGTALGDFLPVRGSVQDQEEQRGPQQLAC